MANEYVSQIQLPNNEIYDIKDKNAVKDITSSDIPGNINFTKGEETKDVLVKDFGLAYGVDLYKDQLPIEVTSPGGNAADWVIEGNDDNGTENLVSPIRTANGWKHGYRNYINGDYVPIYTNGEWLYDVYIPINSASFTFWATNVSNPSSTFYFFDSDKQYLPNTAKGTINYNNVIISNFSPDAAYMQFAFRTYCMSEQEIIDNNYQVMLVKGSTAPDHYIPYQQGVGERTENLFDASKFAGERTHYENAGLSFDIANQTVTVNGTSTGRYPQVLIVSMDGTAIKLEVGETYYGFIVTENVPTNVKFYVLVQAYLNSAYTTFHTLRTTKDSFTVPEGVTNYRYLLVCEGDNISYSNTTVKFFISKTDTSKYLKFGYQIPLTVSQQGQPDKTVDIYIGDTPLTEGETVTKTSTGVDIELFNGENTISTTLYNKPIMEIKPTNSTYNLIEQVKTNKEDILSLHLNITDNTSTTNTTTALTNGNVYLRFKGNKNNDLHKISGTGGTTVTTDTNANILINSPFVSLSNGTITINNNTITPLTSHQSVTDNNPTLSWGTKSKVATIGSTEINVTMPSNPNTDRYVNSASFAHDSTNNNVKMTLTRAGSDTNTVTANIPKVSSSTAGVVPKGATVSSQSQSTKFLREDGSWAAPSYTTNTTYTLSTGDSNGQIKVTPSSGNAYNVDVKGLGSNAYSSTAYLPLTGGTVTGVINIKSSNLDRDGEAPTDDQTGKSLYFVDKDDDGVGRIYTVQRKTNNKKDLFISVYNASGTTNSIGIRILDDGTQSYYLSNPSAFRDTLDNAAYIGTNTITSNQVIIADGTDGKLKSSGYTINKSVPSNAVFTDEKVKTNLIAPEGDEFPIYYLTATGNTTESAKQLFMNDNVKIRIQTGTASAFGRARIMLGNSIEEGTAGNCCGQLQLYSTDSGFSVLRQATGVSSSGITIYLPPKSGTIFNTGNLAAGDNITLTESNGVYSINGTANTDTKVSQTATTTSANYEILFSATADNTTRTEGARKTSGLKYNPDSDRLWIGRSGTSSGSIALYGTINGVSSYGVLKQDYNPNGSNVTHTFPTVGGYVFNSGNVSAGAGITISASGDRYTIKSKNKIYLYKTHTSLFSDINDDAFRSCKYFKIYYKDSNNCNYNCITMNMDTNIFPEGSSGTTSYTNGKVFTLSCIGDVNKTYLRTATFHFATKGGGGIWKLVFNSSFLWDPSQATGSSLTWTSTKQTSYSNSYIKIIKLEYFWEDA